MPDYDFSTLNSSDLEELSCDLMNMSQKSDSIVKYKTFKDGKDKGIDFLYSTSDNDFEHVGQVKHFYRTGFSRMLTALKDKEVNKVKKLKPNKYLFFTSVDLNVSQTEKLKDLFEPFIKSLGDIYGKKDINKLIAKHPKILELHYKLWLNDLAVLKKIFSSEMDFKSSQFIDVEIKKRLRLFVKTPLFSKAKSTLSEKKFIIISGEPGVGKTTLAEMLTYEYIGNDYNLSFIEEANEIDKALINDDSKQIIYYDDFLGSNYAQINKAQESESKLLRVLKQISKLDNKYLILTTRSLLLTKVSEESEKIRRFGLIPQSQVLELNEYSEGIKTELLKNHIEESCLNDNYKKILQKKSLINFIINHHTFTPRSVEFITSKDIIENNRIEIEIYERFIRENFNYPQEIWRHAYTNQIQKEDRLILNTLFSFNKAPTLEELEKAFISRVNYEILTNNYSKEINAFNRSLKRIDGGLILIKKNKVDFINPSLKDFLIKFLKEDNDEMDRIVNSIVFITQFSDQLFQTVDYTPKINNELKNKFIRDYKSFIRTSEEHEDKDLILFAIVLKKYFHSEETDNVLIEVLSEIDDWQSLHDNYEMNFQFVKFIDMVKDNYTIMEVIKDSSMDIVNELVTGESDILKAIEVLSSLKETFHLDFSTDPFYSLHQHFDELFMDLIYNEVEWLNDFISDESEAFEKENEIQQLVNKLNEIGFDFDADLSEFKKDWDEAVRSNDYKRHMEKDD